MSERTDQFADGLERRLTTIEIIIEEAKVGLKEAKRTDREDHNSTSYSVRQKFEAAKQVAKITESSVTKWFAAKQVSDASVVQGLDDECENRQLARQAASAEDVAEAGVSLAGAAIVNAVNATYEAIDAQRAVEHPKTD